MSRDHRQIRRQLKRGAVKVTVLVCGQLCGHRQVTLDHVITVSYVKKVKFYPQAER